MALTIRSILNPQKFGSEGGGRGGGSRSRRPPKAKRCETCMVARPPKLRARNLVHHPPSMKFPLQRSCFLMRREAKRIESSQLESMLCWD
ncbi:hypothetical protein CDAR_404661 [Caerostris darwini]|uniref:Uncharacterized protein n=1 Tax=Caerostris darwini TaxID=1538125 RepID=A0AAV4U4V7_9ARAC|nr:hypothetical protein CDAR_404661 [Caerostris darwini]